MMNERGDAMNFVEFNIRPAVDIVKAWMSTNAEREINIVLNTLDKFELWVGPDLMSIHDSFDDAKRRAETLVTFTIPAEMS
jgi:hypothetical protein